MRTRRIGRSDLEVSVLCLGGNVFGWTADRDASFAVLDAYAEAGGNFIDSADVYSAWAPGNGGGESETILGEWIRARGNRDRVIVATKVGHPMGMGPEKKAGLAPDYIREAAEASLRRLGTDYIDLYWAHVDDPSTPLEDTLGAFDALVKEGKARAIGASNYAAPRLGEALKISAQNGFARYECVQPPYHLLDRKTYEEALEPLCRAEGLGVTTYSSLASGFLSGKYRSDAPLPQSARAGGIRQRYMNERGFAVLAEVERVADRLGATPAQVALAWIVNRPGMTGPIASATTPEQVRELVGAADLTLDEEATAALDRVSAWR